MAKIAMRRSRRENEIIVADLAAIDHDRSPRGVDAVTVPLNTRMARLSRNRARIGNAMSAGERPASQPDRAAAETDDSCCDQSV
jgi:hypothetical protein